LEKRKEFLEKLGINQFELARIQNKAWYLIRDSFKNHLQKRTGKRRIKPCSLKHAFEELPKATSSGFPLNRIGYGKKRDCFPLLSSMEGCAANTDLVFPPTIAG
jgi:hypothetical protein